LISFRTALTFPSSSELIFSPSVRRPSLFFPNISLSLNKVDEEDMQTIVNNEVEGESDHEFEQHEMVQYVEALASVSQLID
jgi:hypothetical protein